MNKKILSKVNMFTQVDEVLQAHPAILELSPALNTMSVHLHEQLALIEQKMQPLLLDRTGFTDKKKAAKEALAQLLTIVCDGLKSYSADTANLGLLGQANYSYSVFRQMRDTQLQETATALYDKAMEHAAALLPYNVNATTLADLNAANRDFRSYNPMPRTLTQDAKANRLFLFRLVGELNTYLRKRMDPVAGTFQISQPYFYERYLIARRNYTEGIRHEQPAPPDTLLTAGAPPTSESAAAFDRAVQEMQEGVSGNGVPVE